MERPARRRYSRLRLGTGQALAIALELARDNSPDLAIIHTPGKSGRVATGATHSAGLVLIPIRPQVFDSKP